MLDVALMVESEMLRRGLQSILAQIPMVNSAVVLGSVGDACTADVVILIAGEPSWSERVRSLVQAASSKVLVLLSGTAVLNQARQASADGFLLQHQVTPESLGQALHQLVEGDVPMPAELARLLLRQATADEPHQHRSPLLTPRERETLQHLVDGLSNKQMGRRMGISEHGAKRLVANVLTKLDSPNRTSAVAVALRSGLLRGQPVGEPAAG